MQHAMDHVFSAAIRCACTVPQHDEYEGFILFVTTIIEFEDDYV